MSDPVSHPQHYSGKIECIDALESACAELVGLEAFCTANAIKYLWRWKRKNGAEDLRKAKWYIDRMLSSLTTPPPVPKVTRPDRPGSVDDIIPSFCLKLGCTTRLGTGHDYCPKHA